MRSATVLFQWGGDGGAHRLAAPSEAKNPRSSDSELYQGFESITLDGPTSVAQLVAFVEGEYVELARSFEPAEKAVRAWIDGHRVIAERRVEQADDVRRLCESINAQLAARRAHA